jgi:hypothetical protein
MLLFNSVRNDACYERLPQGCGSRAYRDIFTASHRSVLRTLDANLISSSVLWTLDGLLKEEIYSGGREFTRAIHGARPTGSLRCAKSLPAI